MRPAFVVVMRRDGGTVGDSDRRCIDDAARRNRFPGATWTEVAGLAVARIGGDAHSDTMVARTTRIVAVGEVRLDHRDELAGRTGPQPGSSGADDLALFAAAFDAAGAAVLSEIVGDYAVVLWDPARRVLVAARDALGGRALFCRVTPELIAVSSRASLLDLSGSWDLEFVADYLMSGIGDQRRTIFARVKAVPAGTALIHEAGGFRTIRHWSASSFEVDPALRGEDHHRHFGRLLFRAVGLHLESGGRTWAQLSGGLDSSVIVCIAQNLAARGEAPALGGTLTLVDTLGDGDERRYVQAVLGQHPVRNEQLIDFGPWQDDGEDPPLTDGPTPQFPFYARDRRMLRLAQGAGAEVLLSGYGSDHYLTGDLCFLADWVARGRLLDTARELIRWAVAGRVSVFGIAREGVVAPLLPAALRHRLLDPAPVPGWVDTGFRRRFDLPERLFGRSVLGAPRGWKYAGWVEASLAELGVSRDRGLVGEQMDVRYPFLYRPLVEFALRLPPEERTQPMARKWVLRQAMRGILPEVVRTRSGKGGIGARIAASFADARHVLDVLTRDPILAQLGCVCTSSAGVEYPP